MRRLSLFTFEFSIQALRGGEEIEEGWLASWIMRVANTIATVAEASRTKYQSNQIGQFSGNKVST